MEVWDGSKASTTLSAATARTTAAAVPLSTPAGRTLLLHTLDCNAVPANDEPQESERAGCTTAATRALCKPRRSPVLAVVVELSTEQLAAAHGAAATKHSAEAMAELTPDKLSYCRSLNRKLQRDFASTHNSFFSSPQVHISGLSLQYRCSPSADALVVEQASAISAPHLVVE